LPEAYLWHPHFFDYQLLTTALSDTPASEVLIILPPGRIRWMEWSKSGFTLRSPLIMYRETHALRTELQGFSVCVVHLPTEYNDKTGMLMDRLLTSMPAGSKIHIFIKASLTNDESFSLKHLAILTSYLSQKPGLRFTGQRSYSGTMRKFMDKWLSETAARVLRHRRRPLKLLWYTAQLALVQTAYIFHNVISLGLRRVPFKSGKSACSAILSFRVEP
jgi:hypothetical protein